MTFCANAVPRERRVRGDDTVDSVSNDETCDAVDSGRVEIRRDLDGERHAAPLFLRERGFRGFEMCEKRSERLFVLQIAQAFRIRRADVDRDVARVGVDLA